MSIEVHPTAVVSPGAVLGEDVTIGPYAVIGDGVVLGARTRVGASAMVQGPAIFGTENRIYAHAALGSDPQDLKYRGEPTRLVVGSRNTFREFMTAHRGTPGGLGETIIGDDNYFMNFSHVAHDNRIGSRVVLANGAALAGHVEVDDYAILSAYSGAHQFIRIGRYAFVGAYSPLRRDVLPYCRTDCAEGEVKTYGLNTIGLKRHAFSEDRIDALQKAYRILVKSKLNTSQALERIAEELPGQPDVEELVRFIKSSERGFIK
jgi:UDP-N-acetylglucosamine acyltransferase